jgi:hypothetical protein
MFVINDIWHRRWWVTLLLLLVGIAKNSEGGEEGTKTCTVNEKDGSTICSSGSSPVTTSTTDEEQQQQPQFCYPDGNCYDTLEDAATKYKNSINFVSLDGPTPLGDKQQISGEHWQSTMDVIVKTQHYMAGVFKNDTMKGYRNECKVRHELCAFWSAIGT